MPRGAATTTRTTTMMTTKTTTKRRSEMPPRKQQLQLLLLLRLQPARRSRCGRPAPGGRAGGRPPSRSRAWSSFGGDAKGEENGKKKGEKSDGWQVFSLSITVAVPLSEVHASSKARQVRARTLLQYPPFLRPSTRCQDGRRPAPQAAGPAGDQDDAQRRSTASRPTHRLQLAADSGWLRARRGTRRGRIRDTV